MSIDHDGRKFAKTCLHEHVDAMPKLTFVVRGTFMGSDVSETEGCTFRIVQNKYSLRASIGAPFLRKHVARQFDLVDNRVALCEVTSTKV